MCSLDSFAELAATGGHELVKPVTQELGASLTVRLGPFDHGVEDKFCLEPVSPESFLELAPAFR